MTKLLKILGRSIAILLEWILIFVILFLFIIRTSPVQTFLAKKATSYLSKELKVEVKIDKVSILFPNELALDGFLMKDRSNDTLFAAGTLYAKLSDYDFKNKSFTIGEVELDKGFAHLRRDKEGVFNYNFIKELFSSKKKKSNVTIDVNRVILSETIFRFDDDRHVSKDYGVDYFHIHGSKINAVIENILIDQNVYSGNIKSISLHEKSGFDLSNLNSQVKVSAEGIYLTELNILSPGSSIYAPRFNMVSKKFTDFRKFVDLVKFDSQVNKSKVSLHEVGLFAPILKGMNDTIQISAIASKRVKDLRLSKLDLRLKSKTHLKGTVNIPDYRAIESGFFQEKIDYAYIDLKELQTLKMPESYSSDYIVFDKRVNRLNYIEAQNTQLDGFYSQFVIATDNISTQLGSLKMDNGIMFSQNKAHNSFMFEQSSANEYDVKIKEFNLGKFLNNKDLGKVDGTFFLSGEAFSTSNINFNSIQGNVKRFDYLKYAYKNIKIKEGKLVNRKFEGKIDVKDDNVELTYDGIVDFKDNLHLNFTVIIQDALLDKLNITTVASKLSSALEIDLIGTNPNNFKGTIDMHGFSFEEKGKTINLPSLNLAIERGINQDLFTITSEIVDAKIKGKIDYNNLWSDFQFQFSKIFPALNSKEHKRHEHYSDNFYFDLDIKDPADFLAIFSPDLKIAPGTTLTGHFLEEEANFLADLHMDWIEYGSYRLDKIDMHQVMDTNNIAAAYHFEDIKINDSSFFSDVYFNGIGHDDILNSNVSWGQHTINESSVIWETEIYDWSHYDFILEPSYVSVKNLIWEVENASRFSVLNDTLIVDDFNFKRDNQSIALNGMTSKNADHQLNFNVENIILKEISKIVGGVTFEGDLNAKGHISSPFTNLQYEGIATINDLFVKEQLVGDINVNSKWHKSDQSIDLTGDLIYRDIETFNFVGDYYPLRESDNLDFNLFFNETNIEFANAFFSPDLVTEIKGLLDGTLKVTGTPDEPALDGTIFLQGGSAKIEILGTHFGIEGPIEVDKYGFYINGIPVFDEEGNAGKVIGSVYHENFADFNFDLNFDIEDDAINRDPENPWKVLPLKKFLVLETDHVPGDSYYGTAYATGIVNIFGYTDNLEITVDLKSRKGTIINIPMYGVGEIDDDSFIVFVDENKDTTAIIPEPKIDFTGVDLNLNFNVTDDAIVKLIFDEEIEDEITARGSGDISIDLNTLGDITMDGIYTVKNGVYDFAMGPVKQKFYIEEGGNISWTGDPYDAILDLRTFYRVNANIATLTNNQLAEGSGSHQQVLCYLNLSESLSKPAIDFDIAAPNAGNIAQSVISRIKSDPDELNRQFFSLLLWRKFQPLAGSAEANGSAAIDLFTNQINALLSKISSDYLLNVNLNSDQLSGDNSYEFGVKKGFLDDRLVLTGSFGVENQKIDADNNENYIIGDVNLEYLLNEAGTFRVNIFNQSNDKTIIQDQEQGTFTQGAGLTYKEDFNNSNDFKAIQYLLDIFRKKGNKRYPIKRKKRHTPLPNSPNESYSPVIVPTPFSFGE